MRWGVTRPEGRRDRNREQLAYFAYVKSQDVTFLGRGVTSGWSEFLRSPRVNKSGHRFEVFVSGASRYPPARPDWISASFDRAEPVITCHSD